ncbi:MAG: dipeptidase, partial [Rhodobacterales bacterium]|nr:dipeptidase [Rhodobacterales bacterium]MDX5499174.1 dipeptidase [Rhodobacterales bacterium]
MTQTYRVFDGHNDLLLHLHAQGDLRGDSFLRGREGHLDLEKCRAGGFAGGFFAIYVPPENRSGAARTAPVAPDRARAITMEAAAILLRLTRARPDVIRLCTSAAQIEAANRDGAIAALMHVEGAEGIGPDLAELEVLHAAGLRSLGPVWSRPNIFGHGVPFAYPATPDI